MGLITKKELHPSLLNFIENSVGGGSIVQKKNSVIITTSVTEVTIGIPYYNKSSDMLMVFKNSVYLEENEDYTISPDNTTINCISGQSWNGTQESKIIFNFVVLKNVPELSELDGSIIKDRSIPNTKLSSELINNIKKINVKLTEVMIKLDLQEESDINELGYWYDTLTNNSKISALEGLKLNTDTHRIVGSKGNVQFKNIEIPFDCDRVRYIHELDDNFIETIINNSIPQGTKNIVLDKYNYTVK